ncbi:hypothetical protein HK098_005219 [Nowakowskiella sp. JEL0407]|nr:hypothetical protein HK098_005219 [Nowakowskiella sp. JEL0407]
MNADFALPISRFVSRSSLAECALVSRQWHAAFTPVLWHSLSIQPTKQHNIFVSLDNLTNFLASTHSLIPSYIKHIDFSLFAKTPEQIYSSVQTDVFHIITSKCLNLNSLNLSGCWFLSDEYIFYSRDTLNPLNSFSIHEKKELGNVTRISRMGKLQSLDISDCVNLSPNGVLAILNQCPELKELDLSENLNCEKIVVNLPRICPNLTTLKLRDVVINDEILIQSITCLPHLSHLDLTNSLQISNTSLFTFLSPTPPASTSKLPHSEHSNPITTQLRSLILKNCVKLTTSTISTIAYSPKTPFLSTLDISGITLNSTPVEAFTALLRNLTYLLTLSVSHTLIDSFTSGYSTPTKEVHPAINLFNNSSVRNLTVTDVNQSTSGWFLWGLGGCKNVKKVVVWRYTYECDYIVSRFYVDTEVESGSKSEGGSGDGWRRMLVDEKFAEEFNAMFAGCEMEVKVLT